MSFEKLTHNGQNRDWPIVFGRDGSADLKIGVILAFFQAEGKTQLIWTG